MCTSTSIALNKHRSDRCHGSSIVRRLDATLPTLRLPSNVRAGTNYFVSVGILASFPASWEYGRDYRSVTFGHYIIFLRYVDKGSERSQMHILHVLHGSRDMDAYFSEQPDDEERYFGLNEENPAGYALCSFADK
jgi:hypothetical protein